MNAARVIQQLRLSLPSRTRMSPPMMAAAGWSAHRRLTVKGDDGYWRGTSLVLPCEPNPFDNMKTNAEFYRKVFWETARLWFLRKMGA